MGLLDQALGSVLGGRSGGMGIGGGRRSPLVNILLMALAAKALHHYMAQRRTQTSMSNGQPPTGGVLGGILGGMLDGGQQGARAGGLGDLLGGIGGAGGLGGLLSGLAGSAGLGSLLSRFQAHGLADTAQSWVGRGPNHSIAPEDLHRVLGPETLQQLSQETGVEPQTLLTELSHALPEAINHLTPEGRIPTEEELQAVASHLQDQLRFHPQ